MIINHFFHSSLIEYEFNLSLFTLTKLLWLSWLLWSSCGFSIFDWFLQWAYIQPSTVKYCSSLIFFNSTASSALGVYKSTQWAQSVQFATLEIMLPFDCWRLAHLQGSKLVKKYLILHSTLTNWKLLSQGLHIRYFFSQPLATYYCRKHHYRTFYRNQDLV